MENNIKVLISSPVYRAGQRALREALANNCSPNWNLARRFGGEFYAGFQAEWEDISVHDSRDYDDERVVALAARRLVEEDE